MRRTVRLIIALTLALCFSCEEQGLFVKCPDCVADEPSETNLELKIDIGLYGAPILINVYEGNLEDSVLYSTFRTSGTHTTVNVTLNKKYTVTAEYYIDESYYITVDSAVPRVKYDKVQCDDPCYFVYDRILDLRLKYTK